MSDWFILIPLVVVLLYIGASGLLLDSARARPKTTPREQPGIPREDLRLACAPDRAAAEHAQRFRREIERARVQDRERERSKAARDARWERFYEDRAAAWREGDPGRQVPYPRGF